MAALWTSGYDPNFYFWAVFHGKFGQSQHLSPSELLTISQNA